MDLLEAKYFIRLLDLLMQKGIITKEDVLREVYTTTKEVNENG